MIGRTRKSAPRAFAVVLGAAIVLGVAFGWWCHAFLGATQAAGVASMLSIVSTAFLRLIRMIVAPLVFATLASGIARMDSAQIGRVGAKALVWFFGASCVSLALGWAMATLVQPGVGAALTAQGSLAPADAGTFGFAEFVTHLVPRSIVEAMANNEILQIVVFSGFFGVAMATLKEKAATMIALCEELATIMLRVTDYVMKASPIAIFAALAATVATQGLDILGSYARFIGGYYAALGLLWLLLAGALVVVAGRRALALLAAIRESVVLAFATASSEAAYPRLLEALVAFGAPRRIANLVLPLGYSFNLDGSMMYCTFAILFIAQAYGISMPVGDQLAMFGLAMIATKGIAGVPRAAIVVVASMLPYFHLPAEGLLLVLAVDHLLDMGRSATNVVGNAVATIAVSCWEREFHRDAAPPP